MSYLVFVEEQPSFGHAHGDHSDGWEPWPCRVYSVLNFLVSQRGILLLGIAMDEDNLWFHTEFEDCSKPIGYSQSGCYWQYAQVWCYYLYPHTANSAKTFQVLTQRCI